MAETEWYRHRACAGLATEQFFDDSGVVGGRVSPASAARRYLAKRVCAVCPVATQCLRLAQSSKSFGEFGVFGGLDQRERQRLAERTERRQVLGIAEVTARLRWEGLEWAEIAERLDMPEEEVRKVFRQKASARTVTTAVRDHSAWADVADGWPAHRIAQQYGIPSEDAEKMCAAMDKQAEYEGPRGKARYATDTTQSPGQAYARAS